MSYQVSSYAESSVYRYRNSSGNLVFSDEQPDNTKSDEVKLKIKKVNKPKPRFYIVESGGEYRLMVDNPLYIPVQIKVTFEGGRSPVYDLVHQNEEKPVAISKHSFGKYKYRWVFGDPSSIHSGHVYRFPVVKKGIYKISQGFKGGFTHSKEYNLYAVDIAMQMGTDLVAARGGVVISVKDDYHLRGTGSFFLDKANHVKILHSDGTYATYGHILMGSAIVKPGDKVLAGQKIARSGSAGYSTGPHLHFVVQKNAGMKIKAVPFSMADKTGEKIALKKGTVIKL
jgi:murein DD-endopeptidase MepM/ murein hydrolase activator NlpD